MDKTTEGTYVEPGEGAHSFALSASDLQAYDRRMAVLDRWLRGMVDALADGKMGPDLFSPSRPK